MTNTDVTIKLGFLIGFFVQILISFLVPSDWNFDSIEE